MHATDKAGWIETEEISMYIYMYYVYIYIRIYYVQIQMYLCTKNQIFKKSYKYISYLYDFKDNISWSSSF